MDSLQALKAIVNSLGIRRDARFRFPVSRQRAFLKQQPDPKDFLERSYDQYLCQMELESRFIRLLYQLAALVLLPVFRFRLRWTAVPAAAEPMDAVFAYGGTEAILPDSLQAEFPKLCQVRDFQSRLCLTGDDLHFLRTLARRYPTAFYFRFKCMLKVGMYRCLYEEHRPKAIIVSEEYSFTSSLLTAYCRCLGVEHINVMHGEKLFFMRDSFFQFDRCYVWDEFYRTLFTELRADPAQFQVELPLAQQPWAEASGAEKTVDLTYYLQDESIPGTYARIADALRTLQKRGLTVAVRPHPIYTPPDAIHLFDGFLVESPSLNIRESILRTRCVTALFSTVLSQAYSNGIPIVIDDVTAPERFEKLRELEYIMLDKPHKLLSSLINEGI